MSLLREMGKDMPLTDGSEHIHEGVQMGPENLPPDCENYGDHYFEESGWPPPSFLVADMTGAQIDPMTDPTAGVLDLIEPDPKEEWG